MSIFDSCKEYTELCLDKISSDPQRRPQSGPNSSLEKHLLYKMHSNQALKARPKETGSEFRCRSSPSSFILTVESMIHSILRNS